VQGEETGAAEKALDAAFSATDSGMQLSVPQSCGTTAVVALITRPKVGPRDCGGTPRARWGTPRAPSGNRVGWASVSEWSCLATAGGVPKHGRAVSRSTQLGVFACPLTRTSTGGQIEIGVLRVPRA
jgi:hypothetical protein